MTTEPHQHPHSPAPLGITDSQLAILFLQLQWTLEEAAHDFPAGRVTPTKRGELASMLEHMAQIVRASDPAQEPTDDDLGGIVDSI